MRLMPANLASHKIKSGLMVADKLHYVLGQSFLRLYTNGDGCAGVAKLVDATDLGQN